MTLRESFGLKVLTLLLSCLLSCVQAGWAIQALNASERLQGYWEGEGAPGRIAITIEGDSLYFYAREDFWYEATFTLPSGVEPPQLHATIKDSSPPAKDIGEVVFAIFKIEDGTLTLAVDDGSDESPISFLDALSQYNLKKVQSSSKKLDGL